ncbi:hypothetical protein STRIP9103_01490, partial [Streptomyces ipomoeae 91-03]
HRRAVPPLVALVLLDGMGEGVPVVEDLAAAGLLEVAGDDLGLDPDGPLDQLGGVRSGGGAGGLRVGLDEVEDHRVGDEAGLDDLGEPGHVVVDRQRLQRGQVAEHTRRRVEGPHEVLALGGVDAGLAADRRVDHGEHGGRDGDPAHPAQPGRRHEPGEVGGGAAAHADDDVGAGEPGLAERLPAVGGDLGGLRLLGVGHLDGDGLVALLGQVGAERLTGLAQRLGVNDRDPLGLAADQAAEFAEELTPHQDLVRLGARRAADLDPCHLVSHHVLLPGVRPAAEPLFDAASPGDAVFNSSASRATWVTSSGVRPSVGTTTVATSSYRWRRASISSRHCLRGLTASRGRAVFRPVRLTASSTSIER